jgi:hypothetical protein
MRLAVTVIVVLLASALMSGCLHVSPLWPLKVDAESGPRSFKLRRLVVPTAASSLDRRSNPGSAARPRSVRTRCAVEYAIEGISDVASPVCAAYHSINGISTPLCQTHLAACRAMSRGSDDYDPVTLRSP